MLPAVSFQNTPGSSRFLQEVTEQTEDSVSKQSHFQKHQASVVSVSSCSKEYLVIGGWPVQFLPPGNALVEEALARAIETEVEGVRTRVMSAEHLVAIALQTGRAKDQARILQFIESGTLDADSLDDILKRHGLIAKWERFGDKFKE